MHGCQHTHTHTLMYRDPFDCHMRFRQLKSGENKEVQGDSQILDQGQCCEHNLGIEGHLTNVSIHHKDAKHNRGYREQEV